MASVFKRLASCSAKNNAAEPAGHALWCRRGMRIHGMSPFSDIVAADAGMLLATYTRI